MKVWRGRLQVAGGWLPPHWDQPERLLQLWWDGSTRYWTGPWGSLVLWPRTRWMVCEAMPALALVARDGGWTSDPQGRPRAGQVVLFWQGEVLRLPIEDLEPGDPGRFWEDPLPSMLRGRPLQTVRKAPQLRLPEARPNGLRDILPTAPLPADEQLQIVQRLQVPQPAPSPAVGGSRNPLLGFFDLLKSQFGKGENQQYFRKMVSLFEQNRLADALRYAIPLEGSVSMQRIQEFFGSLVPRGRLDFTALGGTGFLGTSANAIDFLRGLYERALERLLAEDRIDEAAFVCGELLGRYGQAVDLLEKAGRFQQAARLASLKGLDLSIQARLWFLAGQLNLSMELARRGWCQAPILEMLKKHHPHLAGPFQAAWARDLAAAGRLTEALQIGLEVRHHVQEWESWLTCCFALEQSELAFPETDSVELFAQLLKDEELRHRFSLMQAARGWLLADDLATYPGRRQLLQAMARAQLRPASDLRQLARALSRKALRQAQGPFPLADGTVLQQLIRWTDDPWLTADMPSASKPPPRLDIWRDRVMGRGQLPLWDAIRLADGRLLVAAGVAGMRLISRQGREIQNLPWVCHGWVPCERGQVVIGLGQCDEVFQLTRYGFESGRCQPWCAVGLDAFSPRHDGFLWPVIQQRQLFLIDVRASGWSAPQKLPFQDCLAVESRQAQLRLTRREQGQLWESVYHYPELRYKLRQQVDPRLERVGLGEVGLVKFPLELSEGVCRGYRLGSRLRSLPPGQDLRLEVQGSRSVVRYRLSRGMLVQVAGLTAESEVFEVELPGAVEVSARICQDVLVLADSCGRLLCLDLQAGRWIQQTFL